MTTNISIFREVCRVTNLDPQSATTSVTERGSRILRHYQKTWDRARDKNHLKLSALVNACVANLAGANDVHQPERSDIRL